jgi:pimeloyl-ACP methyl ester carboxylesterase
MFFSVISHLLTKGNLILMELRGMGLNIKPDTIKEDNIEIIEEYFLKGLKSTLTFYKIVNATFICHSFSAYLVLLFTIRYPDLTKRHIKQLVMLSPVGLTPKEEDYKREITSCGDILHTIIHKLGWTFNLTYKSPLRTICSCCKKRLIMNSLE